MSHEMSWRRGPAARTRESSAPGSIVSMSSERHSSPYTAANGSEYSPRITSQSSAASNSTSARPMQSLAIDAVSRTLPHPTTYAGSDNWALTPNGDLPSLPGTPSKAMHALGWQAPPMSEAAGQTTPSKENAISRALLLQRRLENDGHRAGSLSYRNVSPSPLALQRNSPKLTHAGLGLGAPTSPPSKMHIVDNSSTIASGSRPGTAASGGAVSIAAVLGSAINGDVRDGSKLASSDTFSSPGSSVAGSTRSYALPYSRMSSQARMASPAPSALSMPSSGANQWHGATGSRLYRPPHMRTDSTYALKPKMAHYDRVSAPLRGQTRSPDTSQLGALSPVSSIAVSRTSRSPSEAYSPSPREGKRRLSSMGSFKATAEQAPDTSQAFDTKSLIAKLASAELDLKSRSSSSPIGAGSRSDRAGEGGNFDDASALGDVDFTAEDMMMMSNSSLTDGFYRSRTGTQSEASEHAPVVDILEIGDRLGPGMMHDGYEIKIAKTSEGFNDQDADWTGTQLEVISKLGEGSYAVVYLVKEVSRLVRGQTEEETSAGAHSIFESETLRNDTSLDADQTLLQSGEASYGKTLRADTFGRLADANRERNGHIDPVGKLFALKCLCKRDLSETMLEVQRLEATIHQSIPPHPNIVTLHRTYETPEWLFLVLEYCPGQDLFYWLEQAQDSEKLGTATPGGTLSPDVVENGLDSTPPSPGLLASSTSRFLLSRRRLRLVSRMFQQICAAVEYCHSRGIAHRDLKPENFIVEDTRKDGEESATGGVRVKLTDFGLAVAQSRCIDFDCGSKPYMSFECRNNTAKWYDPVQSDVWSLGIVLLNLIFHRNPFSEPNVERCPSFAAYVQDPIYFLTTAFRGLKREAAEYLAEYVFCDVTESEESGEQRQRISASRLSEWASDLEEHLEIPSVQPLIPPTPGESISDAGADFDITMPLWHSRSPSSSAVNSMLSSPRSNNRTSNIHQELMSMGIPEDEIDTFTPLFGEASAAPVQQRKGRGMSVSRRFSEGHQDLPQTLQEETESGGFNSSRASQPSKEEVMDALSEAETLPTGIKGENHEEGEIHLANSGSPTRKKPNERKFDPNSNGRLDSSSHHHGAHYASAAAQALNIPKANGARHGQHASATSSSLAKSPLQVDQYASWRDLSRSAPSAQPADSLPEGGGSGHAPNFASFHQHKQSSPVEISQRWASPASEARNWRDRAERVPPPISSSDFGSKTQTRAGGKTTPNSMSPPTTTYRGTRPPRPLPASAIDSGQTTNSGTTASLARSTFGKEGSFGTPIGYAQPKEHTGATSKGTESNIAKLFAGNDKTLQRKRSAAALAARRPPHHDRATGGIRGGALAASLDRNTHSRPPDHASGLNNKNETGDSPPSLHDNGSARLAISVQANDKTTATANGDGALSYDAVSHGPRQKMLGKFLQNVKGTYSRNIP